MEDYTNYKVYSGTITHRHCKSDPITYELEAKNLYDARLKFLDDIDAHGNKCMLSGVKEYVCED